MSVAGMSRVMQRGCHVQACTSEERQRCLLGHRRGASGAGARARAGRRSELGARGPARPRATFADAESSMDEVEVPTLPANFGGELAKLVMQHAEKPSATIEQISAPVQAEMAQQTEAMRNVVGDRHPMLLAAANHIFNAGGKRVRPLIALLIAKATQKLYGSENVTGEQIRLAMVTEMIHTASLVHDDVLDDCELRRGNSTIHSLYGTRVAVLAGDFLFAQSSWFLANLNNLEVIKLISQVIADFADGEIAQASNLYDADVTVESYLDKSFYKTASLIAASCRSAAVFSGCTEGEKGAMFDYGCNLGLAFQIVDDVLDFTQTTEQLGKPRGQDLASGNITAPSIFALRKSERLRELVLEKNLGRKEPLEEACAIVVEQGGIEEAKELAREHGEKAKRSLDDLPDCEERRSLEMMVDYVLNRIN